MKHSQFFLRGVMPHSLRHLHLFGARPRNECGVTILLAIAITGLTSHAHAENKMPDFLKVSLQDLADTQVTSVSKNSEKASEAAAAITVITGEDIRRSGAITLPEMLRGVPGLQVARAGSAQWAVSSRGFNDQFANKLLVLIDGRTVYSPTFSGVWWDIQSPMREDIERIEVIRGPGATVWGANAVNGVINIITKNAADSQGSVATAGFGNDTQAKGELRHGFKLDDNAYARVYAGYEEHDEVRRQGGDLGNNDAWDMKRGGFRADWDTNETDHFTLQSDAYQGRQDYRYDFPTTRSPFAQTVFDDHEVYGVNLLGRFEREVNEDSNWALQSYLDYNTRDIAVHDNQELTYDLDFQHVYDVNARNTFTWGLGYRFITDKLGDSFALDYDENTRDRSLYSGFLQHKTALLPEELFLTLGSKFEHNDFSGFEVQPSARLAWLPDEHQTVWTAVSRSVRTPDRSNADIINPLQSRPTANGTLVAVRRGSEDVESEELIAYEAGYRIQPNERLAIDVALFFNDYDNLILNRVGTPFAVTSGLNSPYILLPVDQVNGGQGNSYGGEAAINWQARDGWNLELTYSYIDIQLKNGTSSVNTETKTPEQQVGVHSRLDLPHNVEFDQSLYYVDSIGTNNTSTIPDYFKLDMRMGWKPMDALELSLSGQNLLDSYHSEFGPFLYNSQAEIGRSFFAQATVRF